MVATRAMMATQYDSWVDVLSTMEISGWVTGPIPNEPIFVDITINETKVATLLASIYRHDLFLLGMGDGRKGFFFNPDKYLKAGDNHIELSYTDTGETLKNAKKVITESDLVELSQMRWKGDEEEEKLTWGAMMTGDTFVNVVLKHHRFTGTETILEVGPGYGRLLTNILERKVPFAKYLGMEISQARVARLTKKFQAPHIRFVPADILNDTFDVQGDIFICSSTFEHLFPSMAKALDNIRTMARPGMKVFIDFIVFGNDQALNAGGASFENTTAYIRIYSRSELESFFPKAGFRILDIEFIVLGKDDNGNEIRRALVVAQKQ
ncbi:MAG TPA: class I SAM-dependent methyltransferase [Gemmataceae bacterium]|nr:class I SAM-dependent methyltransferase [Gemmataceae bacterium]